MDEVKGFRKGKIIGVFNSDGTVTPTVYKTINQAKKANRTTQYPNVKPEAK